MSDKNLIYSVQFGFRKKCSTVHVLISLTENIRKNLDEGNIGCSIFCRLTERMLEHTVDAIVGTAEHDIFLSKVEHYTLLYTWSCY